MSPPTGRWMAALGAAVSICSSSLAGQSRELSLRVTRAVAVLDSAHTERGIDSLRALLAQWPPEGAIELRVRANVHLGAASLSLGLRDSALTRFSEAVGLDPFATPDPEVFSPDVVAAFREARGSTPSVGVRVAADTVINPVGEAYLVAVAVGLPGDVIVRLASTDGTAPAPGPFQLRVDSVSSLVLPLRAPDSLPLGSGDYRVTAGMPGTAAKTATALLRITPQPVDSAPHDPPPDLAQFRPETRPGALATGSAIGGLLVGLAAVALPSLVSNSDVSGGGMDLRAISIGSSIVIAGIAGVFVGRRPVPVAENIEYNRLLRTSWEERVRRTAAENAHRRRWAPLRIQLLPE